MSEEENWREENTVRDRVEGREYSRTLVGKGRSLRIDESRPKKRCSEKGKNPV